MAYRWAMRSRGVSWRFGDAAGLHMCPQCPQNNAVSLRADVTGTTFEDAQAGHLAGISPSFNTMTRRYHNLWEHQPLIDDSINTVFSLDM